MKFLSAVVATCFATGAWSSANNAVKRDRQLIDDILTQNLADVAALQEAADNFSGDEGPLVEAADTFIQNLIDAIPQVNDSDELSLDDTLAISPKVGTLITASQGLVDTFKERLPDVEEVSQCDLVREKLESISTNSQALIEAITDKVADIAKAIAEQLAEQLVAILNQGIADYQQCNNAGGPGPTGQPTATGSDTTPAPTQSTSYGNATTTRKPPHSTDDCITMTKTTKVKPPPGQTDCPTCPPPECPPEGCPPPQCPPDGCPVETQEPTGTGAPQPTGTDRPPVVTGAAAILAPAGGFIVGLAALVL